MDTHRRTLMLAACTLAAQSLAACGGGGDSGSPAPAPVPPPAPPASTAVVGVWNQHVADTVAEAKKTRTDIFSNIESRWLAMVFAAVHDSLNAIERRYRPWKVDVRAAGANADAAVAAAVRGVLVNLLPAQTAFIDARYQAELNKVAASAAKDAGVALGQQVAAAVVAQRANDGAAQSELTPYVPASQEPGVFQKTIDDSVSPPAELSPVGMKWGAVAPFVMASQNQFAGSFDATRYTVVGPLAVTSAEYAAEFAKVKELGSRTSGTRTTFATDTARFWLENSPSQWNRVAVTFARQRNLNGWDEARLYAALHLAMADSLIACFESKYRYNYWRPITAIRAAEMDGNAATVAETTWVQLTASTPPTPDYPSAHGAAGGAAAAVLVGFFGLNGGQPAGTEDLEADEDNNPFVMDSTTLPGVTRNYRGFRYAARQNSLSREYVGFHFAKAVYDGRKMGRDVGEFLLANALQPV
jgi:hypothetical protein